MVSEIVVSDSIFTYLRWTKMQKLLRLREVKKNDALRITCPSCSSVECWIAKNWSILDFWNKWFWMFEGLVTWTRRSVVLFASGLTRKRKMALQDKILQRKLNARNKKATEVIKAQKEKNEASQGIVKLKRFIGFIFSNNVWNNWNHLVFIFFLSLSEIFEHACF